MELLLIRHAEPMRIVDADGPADPPLHERGRQQAERLAAYLSEESLEGLMSSPLRRARETAEPVGKVHNLPVVVDEELAEWDRAATSYIPVEELRATNDERWRSLVENSFDVFDFDVTAFQQGVVAAVERIIHANPGRKVAVVCHGGVINVYLAHILGLDQQLFFLPVYTSLHRVLASRTGHRGISSLNETAHLRGTGLLLR
jgi:probable phosphoglycerate mutase